MHPRIPRRKSGCTPASLPGRGADNLRSGVVAVGRVLLAQGGRRVQTYASFAGDGDFPVHVYGSGSGVAQGFEVFCKGEFTAFQHLLLFPARQSGVRRVGLHDAVHVVALLQLFLQLRIGFPRGLCLCLQAAACQQQGSDDVFHGIQSLFSG